MKLKLFVVIVNLLFSSFCCFAQAGDPYEGNKADRDSLSRTSLLIRSAFAHGNVDAIMSFHHPLVIKALSYADYQNGAKAIREGIAGTLNSFNLEFTDNKVESLYINGDTAVEQTLFTIKGTPKNTGSPFVFKGRSMIIYVRYKGSPTGWATIREQIQPATD
jgi:ketosteroid isomerase-like protein